GVDERSGQLDPGLLVSRRNGPGVSQEERSRLGDLALLLSGLGEAASPGRRIPVRRGAVLSGWPLAGLHEQRVGKTRALRHPLPGAGRQVAGLQRRCKRSFRTSMGPGRPGALLRQQAKAPASRGHDLSLLLGYTPGGPLRRRLWRLLG